MSFNPTPSWTASCSFPTRNGVFYVGGTAPSVTLSKSGATAYEVRDWYGSVVSSGAVSGTTCTPTAPAGGWGPGWYRIYFTGPSFDAVCGYAYAATSFTVIRPDSRFPTMPASTTVTTYGGETADPVAKGILGLGHSRHKIDSYANYTNGTDNLAAVRAQLAATKTYWSQPATGIDTARPRPLWVSTVSACADSVTVNGSTVGIYLRIYPKTEALDGSSIYVTVAAGTSSGTKITISYPNAATPVEVYDNLGSGTSAAKVINAGSAYVKAWDGGEATSTPIAATALGRSVWNGIVAVVQALYPDIDRFEFTNEPSQFGDETAHQCRLFAAAVHAGNAAAKAIGPCPVSIDSTYTSKWESFLAAGGGGYLDEISFHDYNVIRNGNLALGRYSIENFLAQLASYGLASKPLWQTEAGMAFSGVYGVHHPRRARVKMLHTLLWEQYGVPRERNPAWYDKGHGFWSYPAYWMFNDTSLTADAALHRVLAEETYGQPFAQRLSFGYLADRVVLGSLYSGSGGQCVALLAASPMPGLTVTLATSASGPLTVSDAFGNLSTATVSGGLVTVPVGDVPTYVRLPVGAGVSAYQVADWPPVAEAGAWPSLSGAASITIASRPNGPWWINDGNWATSPSAGTYQGYGLDGGTYDAGMPDSIVLSWPNRVRIDRVLIWNAPPFGGDCGFVDFDVQTSNDGSTWTTRATVTRPTPTSFLFGTGSSNVWCVQETFWDEQWIWDVKLSAPVSARHLRIYVRDVSFGGEPTLAALQAGGQGWHKRITVQEIAVLCDDNTLPQIVTG